MNKETLEKANQISWDIENLTKVKQRLQKEPLDMKGYFFGNAQMPDDDPIIVEINHKLNDALAHSTIELDKRIANLQKQFDEL